MEYGEFKAKKTFYNGVWFDSALESRVAEALDDLRIKWDFHKYAFRDKHFPYGQYTPDFVLGDGRVVEVAGIFDDRHSRNTHILAHLMKSKSHKPMVLVINGDGDTTEWYCYYENGEEYITSRSGDPWNGFSNIFAAAQRA